MKTNQQAIREFCKIEGYVDDIEAMTELMDDASYLPNAICMEEGCDFTDCMEPDQDQGICQHCGKSTVKSLAILMEII